MLTNRKPEKGSPNCNDPVLRGGGYVCAHGDLKFVNFYYTETELDILLRGGGGVEYLCNIGLSILAICLRVKSV